MELASAGISLERLADLVRRMQRTQGRLVSSATTLTAGDDLVLVDTTGGSVTVTLPSAEQHAGKRFDVKKMTAANTCTVQRSGSDTIDGGTSTAWTTQYQSKTFVSQIVSAPRTWGWVIV